MTELVSLLHLEKIKEVIMRDKVKIFMSDLHMGNGSGADDFTKIKEKIFISVIKELQDKYAVGSEIVLLGDVFDLVEHKSEDYEKAMSDSLDAHQPVIESLKGWLKKGNKIFYITGNHDHALRRPAISRLLAERLSENESSEDPCLWKSFMVDDWYISKSFKLYAEHGNRLDINNNHQGYESCFGDIIVKKVLRPLESSELSRDFFTDKKWSPSDGLESNDPFSFIDNIRPRGSIFPWINKLSRDGFLKKEAKSQLRELILEVYLENRNAGVFLIWAIKNVSWIIYDKILRRELNDHYLIYRKYVWDMMDEYYQNNIFNTRDLTFKPDFFIMGHTHFFDHLIVNKTKYINLASWLDTVYVDKKGNIGKLMKNCPVLVFSKKNGTVSPVMYDSSLSTGFDWNDLLEERLKYNIPTGKGIQFGWRLQSWFRKIKNFRFL